MRQGPHHAAHISTSTGRGEPSTSAANVASVTAMGVLGTRRAVLHRPQTGSRPCRSFSAATRFVAPQEGQRMSWGSATAAILSPPEIILYQSARRGMAIGHGVTNTPLLRSAVATRRAGWKPALPGKLRDERLEACSLPLMVPGLP